MSTIRFLVLLTAASAAAAAWDDTTPGTVPAGHYRTDENLNAVLWMQTSIEYRSTSLQTYRAATALLKKARKDRNWTAAIEQKQMPKGKKTAVILDLDETVLDNSSFNAGQARTSFKPLSTAFGPAWGNWVANGKPGLVPGAKEFILAALAQGTHVAYVTNRECSLTAATDPTVAVVRGLGLLPHEAKAGLNKILYCNDGSGAKTKRREAVAAEYRILMLVGDDIGDMIAIPREMATPAQRIEFLTPYMDRFGKSWFQLPNPVYGSWERATSIGASDGTGIIKAKKGLLRVD